MDWMEAVPKEPIAAGAQVQSWGNGPERNVRHIAPRPGGQSYSVSAMSLKGET